jgi:membrane protein
VSARLERAQDRLPPTLASLVDAVRQHQVLLYAGGLAFYALVSVAPFLVIGFWMAATVVGEDSLRELGDRADELAPGGADVSGFIDNLSGVGTGIGLGALVAALWPATAYGSGLVRAFDEISHREKQSMQGVRGRVKALLFLVLLPAFVLGALGAAYFATTVVGDGFLQMVLGWALGLVGGTLAGLVVLSVIYRLFGPDPLSLRALAQGAGAAAAAIAVMSLGYAVYLGQGADFEERVAGSGMASVVLLALWLYLANAILLGGFCLARSCEGSGPEVDDIEDHEAGDDDGGVEGGGRPSPGAVSHRR